MSVDHGETVDNTLGGGIAARSVEAELKVVQDREELFQDPCIGETDRLLFLPDHALPVILEIGGGAEGLVAVAFHLGFEINLLHGNW